MNYASHRRARYLTTNHGRINKTPKGTTRKQEKRKRKRDRERNVPEAPTKPATDTGTNTTQEEKIKREQHTHTHTHTHTHLSQGKATDHHAIGGTSASTKRPTLREDGEGGN